LMVVGAILFSLPLLPFLKRKVFKENF
jgi:hypothetical protein